MGREKQPIETLSPKQMSHLKGLGVDIDEASMFWLLEINNQKKTRKYLLKPNDTATRELLNLMGETERKHSIPTYHIGDLLMKLPTKRVTNAFKKANKKSSRSIINALYKELCDIKQYNIMIEEQQ